MKQIPLTQGKAALVDDEDFEALSAFEWCAAKDNRMWYAVRTIWYPVRKFTTTIRMHRVVLGIEGKKIKVDHHNGDGLDNRRENLRVATVLENNRNVVHKMKDVTSRFKGVCWDKSKSNWMAQIRDGARQANGVSKMRALGRFKNEIQAAIAYDRAARESFGEFAALNFPSYQSFQNGLGGLSGASVPNIHGE